jgi:hypothetical protein
VTGPPNQPVEIYETTNGVVTANGPTGSTTNSSGVWTASGAWQLTDADPYSETWSVANIAASALNFTVSQFTISGTVTYNSSGLSGVTMSGCGSGSVATGSNGSYSIPVLAGSSCTLTPSLAGYTFSPASASFSNVTANQTQNFTATAVSLTISGTVTYGGSGLSGVLMSGNCPSQPTTGSNGSYSITVTYGTSCTLAPSMSGYYTFSPASVPFSDITSSKQQNFTAAPVTSIASLLPASGPVGTSVTIAGNFGPIQGTVTFNGAAATIGSWAANSIGATVPSGATTGPVVVTAGGVASNGVTFTVSAPAPSISSLSPTSGPVGTAVTIAGSNFGSSQGTVTFNGAAATNISSWTATSIGVTVPSAATTGPVVVTAAGLASNGVTFTVTPHIASLSPTSGPVGTAVTIAGTTFGASGTVTFNGAAATNISSWTATSISVTVPSGATTGPVVVTAAGLTSNGVNFTVTPYIASLSPTSGAAGTSVTIAGTTFGASGTVTFNGAAATQIGSWTATSIGVTVPQAATTGPVVVTAGGLASNGVTFTVTASAPSISSLSPTSGPTGTAVTIAGGNFGSSQGTVTFNGAAATNISGWTATSIGVTVPQAATTGPVVVTAGGVASNGVTFTVAYTIGGQITQQANGAPLPNITVNLSGTEGKSTTTTDSNGNYQFTVQNIGQDRNYHVQPVDPNWGFGNFSLTLVSFSGNSPNNNFQAWPMYTISGQVTACGYPQYGVEVDLTYTGVGTTVTYTDQNGNYSFTFPTGGNYSVVPVYQSYSFTPQAFNNLSQNQTASFSIPLPGTCR